MRVDEIRSVKYLSINWPTATYEIYKKTIFIMLLLNISVST